MFYGAGASANAAKIATDFGTTAKALASLPAQHVEVLLGTGSHRRAGRASPRRHRRRRRRPRPSSSAAAADNGAAGRRGDGRRQRQVRNTLRVLTATVCSVAQGGTAMLTARLGRVIAGKVGYAVACLLAAVVLVVSGYAHRVVGYASGFNDGVSTGNAPSTSTQAMNILVMGLESRTNFYGQALPPALITAMHTGPVGGQDPNTLILIHIFAGGQKAVGFSIPARRPGQLPAAVQRRRHQHSQREDRQRLQLGLHRVPGQDRLLHQERLPAGQPGRASRPRSRPSSRSPACTIDHFVETNLAGFYYLAQAFGGVEVCLKPEEAGINAGNYTSSNLYDFNSGLQRGEVRRLQPEEGRRPVPAPVGAAGARVRARARQPGRGRHRPHPPPAGRHRLRDLAAQARERVRRRRHDHRAAQRRRTST